MRIMAIDDEKFALDNLCYLLSRFPEAELVYQSTDPLNALRELSSIDADVLFLDISMPDISGIAFAREVQAVKPRLAIIFMTAYDQYALDAFEVCATDYLLKPVTFSKLKRALDKVQTIREASLPAHPEGKREEPLLLTGMNQGKYYIIKASEAQYIYVEQRKVLLAAGKDRYILKNNLSYWEDRLKGDGWFRCHRAFLINIQQIESAFPASNSVYYVTMKNSAIRIPVSRSYLLEFRKILNL